MLHSDVISSLNIEMLTRFNLPSALVSLLFCFFIWKSFVAVSMVPVGSLSIDEIQLHLFCTFVPSVWPSFHISCTCVSVDVLISGILSSGSEFLIICQSYTIILKIYRALIILFMYIKSCVIIISNISIPVSCFHCCSCCWCALFRTMRFIDFILHFLLVNNSVWIDYQVFRTFKYTGCPKMQSKLDQWIRSNKMRPR